MTVNGISGRAAFSFAGVCALLGSQAHATLITSEGRDFGGIETVTFGRNASVNFWTYYAETVTDRAGQFKHHDALAWASSVGSLQLGGRFVESGELIDSSWFMSNGTKSSYLLATKESIPTMGTIGQRCDSLGKNCSPIEGIVGATYKTTGVALNQPRTLAFKFTEPETSYEHYGWLRFVVWDLQPIGGNFTIRVLGYATESEGFPVLAEQFAAIYPVPVPVVPGDPGDIQSPIPEPSSLALLAAGVAGVSAWRRVQQRRQDQALTAAALA